MVNKSLIGGGVFKISALPFKPYSHTYLTFHRQMFYRIYKRKGIDVSYYYECCSNAYSNHAGANGVYLCVKIWL